MAISSQPFEFPTAISIRYLGGILELPQFWTGTGTRYHNLLKKLCLAVMLIFRELGSSSSDSATVRVEGSLGSEGVDFLIHALLSGMKNWASNLQDENFHGQGWYGPFRHIIHLMRRYMFEVLVKTCSHLWCSITRVEAKLPKAWKLLNERTIRKTVPNEDICNEENFVGMTYAPSNDTHTALS